MKTNRPFAFLFVLFCFHSANAQTNNSLQITKKWGSYMGPAYSYLQNVVQDGAGNFIGVGQGYYDGDPQSFLPSYYAQFATPNALYDFTDELTYIFKMDSIGHLIWFTYYPAFLVNATVNSLGEIFVMGQQTTAPNLATPGSWFTSPQPEGGFLIKLDADGNRLWSTYLPFIGGNSAIVADGIILSGSTRNKLEIATPNSFQPNFIGTNFLENCVLVKLSNEGQRIWGTYYGTAQPQSLDINESKAELILAGKNANDPDLAGYYSTIGDTVMSRSFIAKFSPSTGARLWGNYFGVGTNALVNVAKYTKNNNFYVAGNISQTNEQFATPGVFRNEMLGPSDNFLAKYDSLNVQQWCTYFGGSDNDYFNQSALTIINEGAVVSGNNVGSGGMKTNDALYPNYSLYCGFFSIFSPKGQLVYGSYVPSLGVGKSQVAASSTLSSILFYGSTTSDTGVATPMAAQPNLSYYPGDSASGSRNGAMVKFMGNFEILGIVDSSIGTPNVPHIYDSTLVLFPNPNNGSFTIGGPALTKENFDMSIFNPMGQMVYKATLFAASLHSLRLPQLSAGIYFVKLYGMDTKKIITIKMLKR